MKLFDFIDSSHEEQEDYTYALEFFQWKEKDLEPGFDHQRRRCFLQIFYNYEGDYPGGKSLFRSHFSILDGNTFFNIGFGVKVLSIDFSFFCDSWDFWKGR